MLLHYLGKLKKSNFLQICKKMQTNCILIASNFVIHLQVLIFSVFKIASCSPYWLQIKFCMSLFFYSFTFAIICATENSSQQTSLQCLSTISMVISNKDKILIKTHKYTQNTVIRIEELQEALCRGIMRPHYQLKQCDFP